MNNTIERIGRIAAVTDRRYKSEVRKLRKDSILGGLPPAQRAMVDKWLFDKGMTYQEVAEACGKMFGVTVGRSSVGRYYQSVSKVQSPRSKVGEGGLKVSGSVGDPPSPGGFRLRRASAGRVGATFRWVGENDSAKVSESVGECVGETEKALTAEESYERLLAKVRKLAWIEANLPAELRDVKYFCQLMRILIAARRERNQAVLAAVERKKFERRTAKEALKHLRYSSRMRDDLRGKRNQPRSATAIQDGGEEHRLPFQRATENPILSVVPPGQKHALATHQGLRP